MFREEVPLYGKSLMVNAVCNRAAADLLQKKFRGLHLSNEQLEMTSSERHGAIRLGTPEEYRWVSRFFAAFDMFPHGWYDMTNLGSKSQPVIATAFRSREQPEHRMFTSLLCVDWFDESTRNRIQKQLSGRCVMRAKAKELIERHERDGGLSWPDANELINEATQHIFKWTGRGSDHELYTSLCDAGFKIAADIACFETHHLNHLTPNTLCMDLYTAAMRSCLKEIDDSTFIALAVNALERLWLHTDRQLLRLMFRHLTWPDIHNFEDDGKAEIEELAMRVLKELSGEDFALDKLPHSGFKDQTEGPPESTPVLLRQDAYKALNEDVVFEGEGEGGGPLRTVHSARFGEIEQRSFALTRTGRALYDDCLEKGTIARVQAGNATAAAEGYECAFKSMPKSFEELFQQGLLHVKYEPTGAGLEAAAAGAVPDVPASELIKSGFLRCEGQRYEDFLPFSAAGIFASNLKEYGTACTAATRPTYNKKQLEELMRRPILDPVQDCEAVESRSLHDSRALLGLP